MKDNGRHFRADAAEKAGALAWLNLLWFPLSLLWQEMVVKVYCFGRMFDRGLLYTCLFTLALGCLFSLVCLLIPPRRRWLVAMLFGAVTTLWYMVQVVYYTIFKTFLVLYSFSGAGQAMQFWKDILSGMRTAAVPLLLLLVPVVILGILGRRAARVLLPKTAARVLTGTLSAGIFAAALMAVGLSTGGVIPPKYLYFDTFVPNLAVSNFGVMTTLRLDVKQMLFPPTSPTERTQTTPVPPVASSVPPGPGSPSVSEELPTVYGDNVMDIDFAALAAGTDDSTVAAMHRYFGERTPTRQNAYTGRFAGKNLILITAEGFSRWAVDPELTPTLYRLANTGFIFKNFYNPLWGVSTSDGEYVACTSLLPKTGVWSMFRSSENNMYFCLGNQMKRQGYATRAYHNHTYTYYNRDVSHPNMGYVYKGLGSGLEVRPTWPESDLEMMELTVPEYVGVRRFIPIT